MGAAETLKSGIVGFLGYRNRPPSVCRPTFMTDAVEKGFGLPSIGLSGICMSQVVDWAFGWWVPACGWRRR
jgi:hypothetical protein